MTITIDINFGPPRRRVKTRDDSDDPLFRYKRRDISSANISSLLGTFSDPNEYEVESDDPDIGGEGEGFEIDE